MTKKHQVLRQLDSVTDMAAECINYFVYHPSKDFTRKRKLDAKTFIKTTLAMQGNCLNKELADAFHKPSKRMTASAYEQQKSKVNPRLFKAILYEFNSTLKQPALYHGYRLLAIDGSDFALPYDKNSMFLCNIQTRKKPSDDNKLTTKGTCLIHANILYDIANCCYLDCLLQSRKSMDERSAAVHMLQNLRLQHRYIVLMDRGYESFNLFEHGNRLSNCNYVIRLRTKDKGAIREISALPDQECDLEMTFNITNSAKLKKLHPEYHKINAPNRRYKDKYSPKYRTAHWDFESFCPVHCRIVKLKINDPLSGKTKWEVLATNLSPSDFPLSEMRNLYHLRWDIESSFRKLKYDLGAVCFHAKKPAFQEIELYSQLIMFNVVNRIISLCRIADAHRKWPHEIDFKEAANIVHRYYTTPMIGNSKQMIEEIEAYHHPVRKGRKYPRPLRFQGSVSLNYRFS